MECFGDVQKLPTRCSESSRWLLNRFAATNLDSQILITESANLIFKYDLVKRKSLDSWSFDELNKLLSPIAVYYPLVGKKDPKPQETLVGLHSGNNITEWVPTELRELKFVLKKNFKKQVLTILSFLVDSNFDPVVVFSNGFAEHWAKIKSPEFDEGSIEPVIDANEQIVAIKSSIANKNSVALYYITENKSTQEKFVYKLTIFNQDSTNSTEKRKAPMNEDIEAYTFNSLAGGFIGASKKNAKIMFYSLESAQGCKIEPLFSFDTDPADTLCSIASCRSGAIAILSEKADNESTLFQVQVFDKNYGIQIGEYNISEPIFTHDFAVVGDTLVITCKNHVTMVPIQKRSIRLSQLLTRNIVDDEKNHVKTKNSEKFRKLVGVSEQEQLHDLTRLKLINVKFSEIAEKNLEDIPEELIVSLFDFCTRNYLIIKEGGGQLKDKEAVMGELEALFGHIAKLPYNEVFLVSCLKSSSITFAQYLLAIEWLINMMPCKDLSIISWMSALLDANFSQFIIKPNAEAQAALNRIYFHLNRSIRFYEDLGPIKTIFESLVKRDNFVATALTSEPSIGQYSIELLSFT